MSARQDGDFYCNITTFDHTKPYVRELWLNTLLNATKIGAVGGVFADHGEPHRLVKDTGSQDSVSNIVSRG